MNSTFLLPEILSRKFRSLSRINKVQIPKVTFDYEARLELFSSEIWDIAERIIKATGARHGTEAIPICHATLANGSEQDLYVHLFKHGDALVYLEVSHCYVDQHFLHFQLLATDGDKAREYPDDDLFQREAIDERTPGGAKVGELFVKPVQLTIHARGFDPSPHLPSEEQLATLKQEVSDFPVFNFWQRFERGEYGRAAATLGTALFDRGESGRDTDTAKHFSVSLYALCKYLAGDYVEASRWFLSAADGFLGCNLQRIADICIFFAIEAGRAVSDKNAALGIADEIPEHLSFISADQKTEAAKILRSYYSEVYVGTAVLCRRLVELHVSDLLTKRHRNTASIKQLIKDAKATGKIPKVTGPGLFAILALALADGILPPNDHTIASQIKDFGNNIHERGGVQNEIDAKYAIQAYIHLLHRT
jgi:hypothetical protein